MKKFIAVLVSLFLCAGIAAVAVITVKTGRVPIVGIEVKTNTVRVTVPEGFSVTQIAERLEKNGVCSASDFIAAASDEGLYSKYPLFAEAENKENRIFAAEGYLFPATYDFYKNEAPEKAISRFISATDKRITPEMKQRAAELGYSIDEILTVASIIQKEAGITAEMGKVSSVIYNRLGDSYNRLGCDATAYYLSRYVAPYIDGDAQDYAQYYNTYKCFGLPCGPICSPGLDAINAALYPEDTPYKFFCTDKSGKYYYAEDYEGHLENCKKAGLK